jgi:large subunit ribosomal protein L28
MLFIKPSITLQCHAGLVENDFHYFQQPGRRAMSARCEVTGRTVGFGNTVSHSHRRTRRRWSPNIQVKTYYLPSENRRIKLRVSAKGIKVIDRDGIEAVVARLRRSGEHI